MTLHCHQVNMQRGWGGGEVYTTFLSRALLATGTSTSVATHPDNRHWRAHLPRECPSLPTKGMAELAARLPRHQRAWLLFHTPVSEAEAAPLRAAGHFLSCIAHMPLYGRDPTYLRHYDLVYAVSGHVLDSLRAAGMERIHPEPLWGVADLSHRCRPQGETPIVASSPYDWDMRKVRDRLLSWLYPLYAYLSPRRCFERKAGITLGIVSRLTPIKQFPLLFRHLAPVIAQHNNLRLEIFGAGGYASVRDLRRALAPLGSRARFWGHQQNVAAVYQQLDYLMAGLPEKEALGLNMIEAQACGTPVLAVRAPPFTETIADEITGLFYDDPRHDAGKSFNTLLQRIAANPFRIDPVRAVKHLEQFSEAAFNRRVKRLVEMTIVQLNCSPT